MDIQTSSNVIYYYLYEMVVQIGVHHSGEME